MSEESIGNEVQGLCVSDADVFIVYFSLRTAYRLWKRLFLRQALPFTSTSESPQRLVPPFSSFKFEGNTISKIFRAFKLFVGFVSFLAKNKRDYVCESFVEA